MSYYSFNNWANSNVVTASGGSANWNQTATVNTAGTMAIPITNIYYQEQTFPTSAGTVGSNVFYPQYYSPNTSGVTIQFSHSDFTPINNIQWTPPEPTKEQLAQRAKAIERGEKLVKDWLSPAEYAYLQENSELRLPSKTDPEVIYIVKKDRNRMVSVEKNGIEAHRLCVHTVEQMVDGDEFLSKVAMLKTNEEEFLKIAIKHPTT